MDKLTTERLEELRDHYLGMVNKDIGNALTRLLAYEQAAKNPVAWVATDSEGFPEYNGHNEFSAGCGAGTPLYAAPVLPKQPELIGMKVSIDTGSDNIGHRLFGEIVGTSDSNGVPVLCIEVTENNGDMAAPAQPVIPATRKNTASPMLLNFYIAYHSWVKSGARENGIFSRNAGLCVNAYDYFQLVGVSSDSLLEEMHDDFVANGLNEKLPFNDDPEHYEKESKNVACHLNPIRVQWVESKAQPVSEPYKLEIDMDDADHFSITHLHEIIYGKELIWPEAKLLARFMLDVKQRVSAAPEQESE